MNQLNPKIPTENDKYDNINNESSQNFFIESWHLEHHKNEKSNVSQIQSVMHKAPNLYLKIVSSLDESKSLSLKISPLGLINSKRKKEDGVSYFGYEEETNEPTIDYLLVPREKNIDKKFYGIHFQIRFEPLKMQYLLKDMGNGFGTFIKLQEKTIVKKDMLVNIGENYLVFSFDSIEENEMSENFVCERNIKDIENKLKIKIFSPNSRNEVLSFYPTSSPVSIGRNPDCHIHLNDRLVSRINSTLRFKEGNWYIMDGSLVDGEQVRKSTNGTWEFALEEVELIDKMVFKANHNLFICSFGNDDEFAKE